MAHICEHRLDVVQVGAVQDEEIKGRQGDHKYRHSAEHWPIINGRSKKALTLAGEGPSHGRELRHCRKRRSHWCARPYSREKTDLTSVPNDAEADFGRSCEKAAVKFMRRA